MDENLPLHLHVNQKHKNDDDDKDDRVRKSIKHKTGMHLGVMNNQVN